MDTIKEEKEIREELGILANQLGELDQAIETLMVNIAPLLLQNMVEGESTGAAIKSLCPLAEELREYRFRVESVTGRVSSANQRIQI